MGKSCSYKWKAADGLHGDATTDELVATITRYPPSWHKAHRHSTRQGYTSVQETAQSIVTAGSPNWNQHNQRPRYDNYERRSKVELRTSSDHQGSFA